MRSTIISTETNTMPIITIWMACSSGVSHSVDWMAMDSLVLPNHRANSNISRSGLGGGQHAFAVLGAALDRIAVLAHWRRLLRRALVQIALAGAGHFATAQRMHSHAENGAWREVVHRDVLRGGLRRA